MSTPLSTSQHTLLPTLARQPSSSSSSHITKTYRQASTLFLTRRLPEALSTVLPLITPPSPPDEESHEPSPISLASRSTRIKVWSLYLTVLNTILELDPEEGKQAFGTQEWRGLCTKVREGEVWEEVVRWGYHGEEGEVDGEVVINLATLLLAHAKTQAVNQKRLENYLAAARTPSLDLEGRFGPKERIRAVKGASGADTPRDLNARVKILELYTLHVLVRNNEWEYAREFISHSAVLDEERREAFLQALQSLQDEQREAEKRERKERQRQEEAIRKDIEEARRLRAENEERERKRLEEERARRQAASEVDYGIEKTPSQAGSSGRGKSVAKQSGGVSRPSPSTRKSKAVVPAPSFSQKATMVLSNIKTLIDELAKNFQTNPYLLYRTAAFIVGLLLLFSRKSIRDKIRRVLGTSWRKVRATAGMGVKVSYI